MLTNRTSPRALPDERLAAPGESEILIELRAIRDELSLLRKALEDSGGRNQKGDRLSELEVAHRLSEIEAELVLERNAKNRRWFRRG